ncbi:MAG TPA: tetratricopeptide repeat protein [Terriglobales bacterium]|nr:tetratricopeptide repeat protein [Terriglobales bacterium]
MIRQAAGEREHDGNEPAGGRERRWLVVLLLVTALSYAVTLGFGFVYDDHQSIEQNPLLTSWRNVPRFFSEHFWSHLPGVPARFYRPLLLLWFIANRSLFGLDASGFHATTVLVHLLATVLVYGLGVRLLEDRRAALVGAMVFALHPLHVESVAWISGVCDPLLTVGFVGAFLCYLKSRQAAGKRAAWTAAALLLFAGALAAKEVAVVLAALVFLHAYFTAEFPRQARRMAAGAKSMLPYLVLALAFVGIRAKALGGWVALTSISTGTALLTAPQMLAFYVRLLVWPTELSPYYDLDYVRQPGIALLIPLAMVAVCAAAVGWWWSRSRDWRVAFAALWGLLALAPALNARLVNEDELVHDRYLYLASVGFALLAGLGWRWLDARLRPRTQWLAPGLAILAGAAMALASAQQSLHWKDDLTLFTRAVEIAPRSFKAQLSLAVTYKDQGKLAEAIRHFQAADELRPGWLSAFNLGICYYESGDFVRAEEQMRRAITFAPAVSETYARLAVIRLAQNGAEEAQRLLQKALEISPKAPGYHFLLGVAYANQGRTEEALAAFGEEIRRYPGSTQATQAREAIRRLEAGTGRER